MPPEGQALSPLSNYVQFSDRLVFNLQIDKEGISSGDHANILHRLNNKTIFVFLLKFSVNLSAVHFKNCLHYNPIHLQNIAVIS